ncbi:hypothetical protein PMZ84_23880, partial [[Clostridium] symbiosum]|uniref:hypothetical protein n=1 Tax=Clostridium symbiosum TaxID=1512 RepID=UPI001A9AEA6F
SLLWLCCCGDYIIPKRGGHCFFIFKSGVIPENTRFLIKNGVSDLTLPRFLGRAKDATFH